MMIELSLHGRKGKKQSGLALVMVMMMTAILIVIVMTLLVTVDSNALGARSVQNKNQTFNAAESGLQTSVDALDQSITTSQCASGTIGNYKYTCGIVNNFNGPLPLATTDPGNGSSITVPAHLSLVWGKGTTAAGERSTFTEAIVSPPRAGLDLPDGVINAKNNINGSGDIPVYADPADSNPHDATVRANGNIAAFAASVDGLTSAVGSNAMPGWNGTAATGASPVKFPTAAQVSAFTSKALTNAQSGTRLTAAAFVAGGSQTYTGNLYIDGTVKLTSSTITIKGGATVYINGALCVSGAGKLINDQSSLIVVTQQLVTSGAAYSVTQGTRGLVIVLGNNNPAACSSGGEPYAVAIGDASNMNMGLIYAANGSTTLSGNGSFRGALIAGVNADFQGGGNGLAVQYDSVLVNAATAQNVKIIDYGNT